MVLCPTQQPEMLVIKSDHSSLIAHYIQTKSHFNISTEQNHSSQGFYMCNDLLFVLNKTGESIRSNFVTSLEFTYIFRRIRRLHQANRTWHVPHNYESRSGGCQQTIIFGVPYGMSKLFHPIQKHFGQLWHVADYPFLET